MSCNTVITSDINLFSIPFKIHYIYKTKDTSTCSYAKPGFADLPPSPKFTRPLVFPISINGTATHPFFQGEILQIILEFLSASLPLKHFVNMSPTLGSYIFRGENDFSLHPNHLHLDHLLTAPCCPTQPIHTIAWINFSEYNASPSLSHLNRPSGRCSVVSYFGTPRTIESVNSLGARILSG